MVNNFQSNLGFEKAHTGRVGGLDFVCVQNPYIWLYCYR